MVPEPSASATARFRRQHEELLALAKELGGELDTRTLARDPSQARKLLAAFTGKLRVHAAMEDDALYPRLLASGDPDVVAKARALRMEVGELYESFFAFVSKWSSSEAIQADPEGFGRDTIHELYRLGRRMKRENQELYPLVDAHESASRR
jgi:hypothetical protein